MFTGIVEALGEIAESVPLQDGVRLTIASGALDMSDVKIGDSIAVNGVCLTATTVGPAQFTVDVSRETLNCSTGLREHGKVNLEKAMRLTDRLGGHLVSGHVDGVGQVVKFEPAGESMLLAVRAPSSLSKYIAAKGSITMNGVSLTVNRVRGDEFEVNLIPHTLGATTLQFIKPGDPINLEVDLLARYVERMLNSGHE